MSTFAYERYLTRVTRQPWALLPEKLAELTELARLRASGHRFSDQELAARIGGDARPASSTRQRGAIAIVPVHGVLVNRGDSFEASSGAASAEMIGRHVDAAANDPSVTGILLDFDTPGGNVEGIQELAAKIRAATNIKPTTAHVNALAASAGYWLASQASEIVITPSGMAGSIGVYMLVVDQSEALKKEGIVINSISAGSNKLEGAWWTPLSDAARAHLQAQVDTVYAQFVGDVARGRGVTTDRVRKHYGEGRVFDSKQALARGMVDAIEPFDATLARMVNQQSSGRRLSSRASADDWMASLSPADREALMIVVALSE